jgi:hypothetical protein
MPAMASLKPRAGLSAGASKPSVQPASSSRPAAVGLAGAAALMVGSTAMTPPAHAGAAQILRTPACSPRHSGAVAFSLTHPGTDLVSELQQKSEEKKELNDKKRKVSSHPSSEPKPSCLSIISLMSCACAGYF